MTISSFSPERYFPSIYDLPFSYRNPDRLNACPGFAFYMQIFHGGPMWASAPTEHNDAWRKLSGASGKSQKRCQWQKKRGDFECCKTLADSRLEQVVSGHFVKRQKRRRRKGLRTFRPVSARGDSNRPKVQIKPRSCVKSLRSCAFARSQARKQRPRQHR